MWTPQIYAIYRCIWGMAHINVYYLYNRDIQYTIYSYINENMSKICPFYFCPSLWPLQLPHRSWSVWCDCTQSNVLDHWVAQLLLCSRGVWGKNCIVGASATFIRGLLRFGGKLQYPQHPNIIETRLGPMRKTFNIMTNSPSWTRPCWFAFKKPLGHKKKSETQLVKIALRQMLSWKYWPWRIQLGPYCARVCVSWMWPSMACFGLGSHCFLKCSSRSPYSYSVPWLFVVLFLLAWLHLFQCQRRTGHDRNKQERRRVLRSREPWRRPVFRRLWINTTEADMG